ncbi:MAG: hypothetical protein LBH26_04930 [Treponema sp.]|jgi:hypothetical protein|nr:hypothetical protein [Treponema sp.]
MDEDFVKPARKIVNERGKDILNNGKLTKALFMDYSHGEYKNQQPRPEGRGMLFSRGG